MAEKRCPGAVTPACKQTGKIRKRKTITRNESSCITKLPWMLGNLYHLSKEVDVSQKSFLIRSCCPSSNPKMFAIQHVAGVLLLRRLSVRWKQQQTLFVSSSSSSFACWRRRNPPKSRRRSGSFAMICLNFATTHLFQKSSITDQWLDHFVEPCFWFCKHCRSGKGAD